jgi:hypothetical protein
MNFIKLTKFENKYWSNWKTSYDSDVYIFGTIEPFTYHAEENDDEEVSLFPLSNANLNLLKSKI